MGFSKDDFERMQERVTAKRSTVNLVTEKKRHMDPVVTIEVDPMGAPRMNRSDVWRKRPVVLRYREYKDEIRRQCRAQDWEMDDQLNVEFRIPMPASWSKKKRQQMDGRPHTQKPDIDNLVKGVMDSFGEDKHVHRLLAFKVWGQTGAIIIR